MKITTGVANGRKVWQLDNEKLTLSVMEGGGNVSGLKLRAGPNISPYWVPIWKTVEPWKFRKADTSRYGVRLLASISGHNLCLGAFGDPSPEEARAGMECHGEATVSRWKTLKRQRSKTGLTFAHGARLPIAEMDFTRTFVTARGSNIFRVREEIRSLSRKDQPYTMCQHVTFGPPFLEKGVTVFDTPATQGHTFIGEFNPRQRLRSNAPFEWPKGPGKKGAVDLRRIGKEFKKTGDFCALRMDPKKEFAWFSAVNPELGLLVAYVWKRDDFPWLGNWEENFSRDGKPWAGRTLARGMEFTNTPFPVGIRKAVSMGKFQGIPTYRWLPARSKVTVEYRILAMPVWKNCRGVADIRPAGRGLEMTLITGRNLKTLVRVF